MESRQLSIKAGELRISRGLELQGRAGWLAGWLTSGQKLARAEKLAKAMNRGGRNTHRQHEIRSRSIAAGQLQSARATRGRRQALTFYVCVGVLVFLFLEIIVSKGRGGWRQC